MGIEQLNVVVRRLRDANDAFKLKGIAPVHHLQVFEGVRNEMFALHIPGRIWPDLRRQLLVMTVAQTEFEDMTRNYSMRRREQIEREYLQLKTNVQLGVASHPWEMAQLLEGARWVLFRARSDFRRPLPGFLQHVVEKL